MQTETVTIGKAKFTFSNAALCTIRRQALARRWPDSNGDELPDRDERDLFLLIASHCVEAKGIRWDPPAMTATADQIEKSYMTLLTKCLTYPEYQQVVQAVLSLYGPVADELDQPDETLTEAQDANPT